MKLDKETALRLWKKQFGKAVKAHDFAGREIAKASYNDRNSKYGWNVDHIYPQSQGGRTADYNLICCHIVTNDEKGSKFPCFSANQKDFEIRKRENHYEIFAKSSQEEYEDDIDFFDYAQGLDCWKECKHYDKELFTGYARIKVSLSEYSKTFINRFRMFLLKLFDTDCVYLDKDCHSFGSSNYIFTVVKEDLPTEEDIQNLLDDCMVLNTYAEYYFYPKYKHRISIICGCLDFPDSLEATFENYSKNIFKENRFADGCNMLIDELVKINTDADEDAKPVNNYSFVRLDSNNQNKLYQYDYTYTTLAKNLEKLFK